METTFGGLMCCCSVNNWKLCLICTTAKDAINSCIEANQPAFRFLMCWFV